VIRNLMKCISLAGFYIAGCILAGVAYSFRILAEDEKRDGVALLNICKDMTELAIFKDSNLRQYKAFHVGASDILAADNTVNQEGIEQFRAKINSISALHDVKSAVITGEAALNDAVIAPLENLFSCPARVGFCIARPLEDLPSERMAYVGTLGIMDYLQGNSFMWSYGGGFLGQKFKKVISFLDNYF
jgi:hypothetical protein